MDLYSERYFFIFKVLNKLRREVQNKSLKRREKFTLRTASPLQVLQGFVPKLPVRQTCLSSVVSALFQ